MSKIAILGAGGFGSALALVLSRADHQVTLGGRNEAQIEKREKTKMLKVLPKGNHFPCPDSLSFAFGQDLALVRYDFAIICVPTTAAGDLLAKYQGQELPPLVFVQKGWDSTCQMHPIEALWQARPDQPALLFTGAAFAEDLANGAAAEMIICHRNGDSSLARQFCEVLKPVETSIWPVISNDIRSVCLANVVRTIASCQAGVAVGILRTREQDFPSTYVSIRQGIIAEYTRVCLQLLEGSRARFPQSDTPVGRVLQSDILMCTDYTTHQLNASRNFRFGYHLGHGLTIEYSSGLAGATIEALHNTGLVAQALRQQDRDLDAFPCLAVLSQLLAGEIEIEQVARLILDRRERRFPASLC